MSEKQTEIKNYDRELGAIDVKINFLEKRFERYEIDTTIKLKDIKDQNDKLEKEFKNNSKELEDKLTTMLNNNSKELEDKLITILNKIEDLKYESTFSKGFIKATLFYGTILGVVIGIVLKFVK